MMDEREYKNDSNWFVINGTWINKSTIKSIWYQYKGKDVGFAVNIKTDDTSYSICFEKEEEAINYVESQLNINDDIRYAFR